MEEWTKGIRGAEGLNLNKDLVMKRFMLHVNKTDGCWEWTGLRNYKGYGRFTLKKPQGAFAHRVSHALFIGPIPDGMCVMHACDNRGCVNPSHLSAGSNAENIKQRNERGRTAKGFDASTTKISAEQVLEIRALKGKIKPEDYSKYAAKYPISIGHFRNLLHNHARKDVK